MSQSISEEIKHYKDQLKKWSNITPKSIDPGVTTEDMWPVIDSYVQQYGWISHQIESYNTFVSGELQSVIENTRDLEFFSDTRDDSGNKIKHIITFGKTTIGWPQHIEKDNSITRTTPEMCRVRDLSYTVPVYCKIEYHKITQTVTGIELNKKLEQVGDVLILELPVMLRSKLCVLSGMTHEELIHNGEAPEDLGGYFIVNGNEKVIVSQESSANNKIFVNFDKKLNSWVAKIICQDYTEPNMVQSMTAKPQKYKRTNALIQEKSSIQFGITPTHFVPIFVMFYALGITNLNTIRDMFPKNLLWLYESCLQDLGNVVDSTSALVYIGKNAQKITVEDSIRFAKNLIKTNLFVHIPDDSYTKKAIFMSKMLTKLLKTMTGELQEDDKDSLVNKRIDCVGNLIKELVETRLREILRNDLYGKIESRFKNNKSIDILKDINMTKFLQTIKTSFATGNWTRERAGIMIDLHRIGYTTPIAELRRTKLMLSNPTASNLGPHRVHTSFFGYFCPSETTDGTDVGLLKQLALLARISLSSNPSVVIQVLNSTNIFLPVGTDAKFPILINNNIVGSTENPTELVKFLRTQRRLGKLQKDVSVCLLETNEIHVLTDAGRLTRPLLIVNQDGMLNITHDDIQGIKSGNFNFNDLLTSEKIEYLDCQEIDEMLVAIDLETFAQQKYKYTHLEIHPIGIFSTVISSLPFPNYNAGVRVMWSGGNFRQALGVYASNYTRRFDTSAHVLMYTHRPIVYTKPSRMLGIDQSGSGQSVILAIASYAGFNQDDCLVFNASAIQRGMFRSFYYHTHKSSESEDYARKEEITNPEKYFGSRPKYSKLDSDGIIRVGEAFNSGDILIGKVIISKTDSSVFVDSSEIAHSCGVVESVVVSKNADGYTIVKVKTRELRIPELGDKFCPRHFQKGTIGMVYRQEDLPFTRDGVCPDVFLSPYGLTGRMTVGILFEVLCGKASALTGEEINSTGFDRKEGLDLIDDMSSLLVQYGFSPHGTEMLCDGFEGRPIESKIFLGPLFQQKLKQMSADKIQARSGTGKLSERTRQPVSGRAKGGGGRIAEMERDAMIAHGISRFINEKMFDVSDKYSTWICTNCGVFANANYQTSRQELQNCSNCGHNSYELVDIPYGFKLMHQYMYSLGGVNLRLGTNTTTNTIFDSSEDFTAETPDYEEETAPMTTKLGEVLNEALSEETNYDLFEEDEYSF